MHTELYTAHLNREYRQMGIRQPIAFSSEYMCANFVITYDLTETENFQADLDIMKRNPEIRNRRDASKADIVMMIAPRRKGTDKGLANNPGTAHARSDEKAYGISAMEFALNDFTLAHEVGHIFGLYHERADYPNPAHACKYGYYLRVARNVNSLNRPFMRFRSIMATASECERAGIDRRRCHPRIGWFSYGKDVQINPAAAIRFGVPCNGPAHLIEDGPASNADIINLAAPIISNYR
ncbi:MAG: zinc-dependent metalloprotease family protein [Bacteroidota bacterium]